MKFDLRSIIIMEDPQKRDPVYVSVYATNAVNILRQTHIIIFHRYSAEECFMSYFIIIHVAAQCNLASCY